MFNYNTNLNIPIEWGPYPAIPFPTKQELASIKQRLNQAKEQQYVAEVLKALDEICTYLESDLLPKNEFDRPLQKDVEDPQPSTNDELSEKQRIVADNQNMLIRCYKFYEAQVSNYRSQFCPAMSHQGFNPLDISIPSLGSNPQQVLINLDPNILVTVVEAYIDYCEDKFSEFGLYNDINLKKLQPYKDLRNVLLQLIKAT